VTFPIVFSLAIESALRVPGTKGARRAVAALAIGVATAVLVTGAAETIRVAGSASRVKLAASHVNAGCAGAGVAIAAMTAARSPPPTRHGVPVLELMRHSPESLRAA
jgi:hypothetical protein